MPGARAGDPGGCGVWLGVGGVVVRVELFFKIKNLIKNFYMFYLFSSKTPHLLHRVPMERPPSLSRTATDSTVKGQQGALLPSFLPGWPPGGGGAVCPISGGRGGGPLASAGTSGRWSTSAQPGPQASRASGAEARGQQRAETRWWLT